MRRGEMLLLRWSDVNFEARKIRIRAENAKAKRDRIVEMNSIVSETLKASRADASASVDGLIFSGKGYAPTSVTNDFSELCDRLEVNGVKLEGITLHRLRHTFRTSMKDNNENPFVVRDSMGYARISTTEGYIHDTPGNRPQAVERLEKYAKWRVSDTSSTLDEGRSD
jgi:integrase